jgi:hypothetical protein
MKIIFRTGLCALLLCYAPFAPAQPADAIPAGTIELPLVSGWFQGRMVHYVTTDVSDANAAQELGANYVPRLANAIPPQPRYPGQPSAIERIYSFGNFKQGGVLPSLPTPAGEGNADRNYSPLWLVHKVNWLPGHPPRVLKSEEEVLAAADKGEVSITQTNVVVNCPVIFSPQGGLLKGAKINLR